MKNYIKILILLITVLFTFNCFAYTAPPVPPDGTYVLDLANKLSSDQVYSLNTKIQGIKSSTSNEFAVLILQNMDGNNIEDVAYTVFNTWGVGKKDLDNGVLIVISVSERKSRIETGKGVGELTDLQCSDILANTLRPFLKKGDFYGGLNATIDAASGAIENRKNIKPLVNSSNESSSSESSSVDSIAAITALLIFGGFALFAIVIYFITNIRAEKRKQEQEIKEAEEYKKQWERAQRQVERDRAAAIERAKNIPSVKPSISKEYKIPTRNINGEVTIPKAVAKESFPTKKVVVGAAVVGAGILAAEEIARKKRKEDARAREEERSALERRREENISSNSSSWPSSSDSGSSWGGGGFDGGSSGGGGASGDW